jgi:hypothetical protein
LIVAVASALGRTSVMYRIDYRMCSDIQSFCDHEDLMKLFPVCGIRQLFAAIDTAAIADLA